MEKLLREIYLQKKEINHFEKLDVFNNNLSLEEKKVLEYIKININNGNKEFRKKIFNLKKEKLNKEKEQKLLKIEKLKEINLLDVENEVECNLWIEHSYLSQLQEIDDKLAKLNKENIYKIIEKEAKDIEEVLKIMKKDTDNYCYEIILDLIYKDYLNNIAEPRLIINEENNILKKEYSFINEDDQYKKYGLIKLNENRVIEKNTLSPNSFPQYICDKRLKKYITIEDISCEMLVFLSELLEKKDIEELSLRVSIYTKLKDNHTQMLLEDKEFGKYFSFGNLKEILPTKLYNMKNDELWINIDKKNITFEEILEDFENYGDYIVTQVVHCEYFEENQEFFINHLDHEYIFYTMEEYEERQNNINQKGNGSKRVKTFKIDNSKIPFILDSGDNFLLKILNEYFKSKDLLEEYFQNINN